MLTAIVLLGGINAISLERLCYRSQYVGLWFIVLAGLFIIFSRLLDIGWFSLY